MRNNSCKLFVNTPTICILKYLMSLSLISISIYLKAQTPDTLQLIGQTPGGAAHHVHWIEEQNKLIVGCGASLWVYDMTNPSSPQTIAKRAFLQPINHTDLYGDTLFAAATNDGLYALDFGSDSLTIIDLYIPTGLFSRDVSDFVRSNDTLYIPDKYDVKVVRYHMGSFHHIVNHTNAFVIGDAPLNMKLGARCIDFNDNYIAIGKILDPFNQGRLSIYDRQFPYTRLAFWEDSLLNNVERVQFADLKSDIIYVCAGSTTAGLSANFFACHFTGSEVMPVDTVTIYGLPLFSSVSFLNIDSRNDTVYLVTNCLVDLGVSHLSMVPVYDATNLPEQPLDYLGFSHSGAWYFDIALMHGTDYMAVASEWLGLLVTNISDINNPLDTIALRSTGGWVQQAKVHGDTIYVAHEGWGIAAYLSDSLMHQHGYDTDAIIMHEYIPGAGHFFVSDFEFIDDTIMFLGSGDIYNLKPWFDGGEPELTDNDSLGPAVVKMNRIKTPDGDFIIIGRGVWLLSPFYLSVYDPNTRNFTDNMLINNEATSIAVADSIVFFGLRTAPYFAQNAELHLIAAKIIGGHINIIADLLIAENTNAIIDAVAVENNIVAIGMGNEFRWYNFTGSEFSLLNSFTHNVGQVASGAAILNSLLYASYRNDGLMIIDIDDGTELAYFRGSGGFFGIAGSGNSSVRLGNDGTIYLSDFYSGLLMVEIFDHSLVSVSQPEVYNNQTVQYKVYPNPASNNFYLEINPNASNSDLQINLYNIIGEKVSVKIEVNNAFLKINTENLSVGQYILKICNGDGYCESTIIQIE